MSESTNAEIFKAPALCQHLFRFVLRSKAMWCYDSSPMHCSHTNGDSQLNRIRDRPLLSNHASAQEAEDSHFRQCIDQSLLANWPCAWPHQAKWWLRTLSISLSHVLERSHQPAQRKPPASNLWHSSNENRVLENKSDGAPGQTPSSLVESTTLTYSNADFWSRAKRRCATGEPYQSVDTSANRPPCPDQKQQASSPNSPQSPPMQASTSPRCRCFSRS